MWADERLYYPLHARPYTPAHHFPRGNNDPDFRTKPQLAVALARHAQEAGVMFRAVAADCAYGDNDALRTELRAAGLPFVLALRPHRGSWASGRDARTPTDAAGVLPWGGSARPGVWTPVVRRFRDGHTTLWWAAEARLGGWGPDERTRLVVATTDPIVFDPQRDNQPLVLGALGTDRLVAAIPDGAGQDGAGGTAGTTRRDSRGRRRHPHRPSPDGTCSWLYQRCWSNRYGSVPGPPDA